MGHTPVYGPGGKLSHRTQDGTRVTSQTRRKASGKRLRDGDYCMPKVANPGNVIDCGPAGGGNIGHPLAHENEAPFAERVAEWFVRSCCPPGGVVLDPFSGSGTTAAMASRYGRRFIAVDNRASQTELGRRRVREQASG